MLMSLASRHLKAASSFAVFSRSLSSAHFSAGTGIFRTKPIRFVPVFRFMSTAQPKMPGQNVVLKRHTNITKGAEDQREYRGLELANGLRVLLVSDPSADKSAAAMDVAVGHLMDRWELPGTAHFCEHMLFLGTDKYPSENEYGKFISAHAGSTNAFTSSDHTNYHFDIKPDQLHGALDRFVQFFLAPQFTESATEREVCAVDSEHSNNLKNDSWRNLQIDRSMSKKGHDYGKFGTGNKRTLLEDARAKGIEPREALLQFHKKWYSSNIMSCCIVGSESLDQMESYLGTLGFDAIENKNVEKKRWEEHPYGPEQLGKKVMVVPIKDSRSLKLSFPIQDVRDEYRSQPAHYLSHLLGHEGPGSLLSELKRRGWVSSLSAGEANLARGLALFDVQVDLSSEGVEHTDEIVELVFNYIGLIKRSGPQQWIQDELKAVAATKFRFKDKENPMSMVTSLATELQLKSFEDVLSSQYLITEYKPKLITDILERLVPTNMMYRVVAQKFAGQEGNTNEPIYGTEMRIEQVDKAVLDRFSAAISTVNPTMHLPEKNEFIPTKFDLKPREALKSEHPRIIYDDVWTRVWFKQDDEYKLPKMVTKVCITSPLVSRCPRTAMLSSLYLWCLNDALTEETYNADIAGLKFQLDSGPYGSNIKVGGYDEKQPMFVKALLKRMVNFKPDPVRYAVLFDALKRALENFSHSQPYSLSQHYMLLLISEKCWSKEQLLSVCDGLTPSDVEQFGKEMLDSFHVEIVAHGNTTEKDVLDMAKDVTATLRSSSQARPLFRNEYVPYREHALDNGDAVVYRHFQNTHDVSAVELVLQAGVQNTRDNTILELLVQLMREPAFNQLRTNEQLGYIVWTGSRLNCGTLGLQVIVQGPKEPDFVLDRVEAFLTKTREDILTLTPEEFTQQVEGLVTRLQEKPKTMNARFRRFANEIEARQYDFDRNASEVDELRTITKEQLIEFYDRKFIKGAPERRKMAIFVHGKDHTREKADEHLKTTENPMKEVECMESLRQSLSLYARPRPKMAVPPFGADILTTLPTEKAKY